MDNGSHHESSNFMEDSPHLKYEERFRNDYGSSTKCIMTPELSPIIRIEETYFIEQFYVPSITGCRHTQHQYTIKSQIDELRSHTAMIGVNRFKG